MTLPRLMIVLASIRPGRVGEPVARWFLEQAERHGGFALDLVDLRELALPLMEEPNHPRLRQYTLDHTHEWSVRVDRADAVVFVMPEYNYGYTAPLKNAFDYLMLEWLYKPVGFVSYGGVAAGTRAVQQFKQVVTTLKMTPVTESVSIPFVFELLRDGELLAADAMVHGAQAMLEELGRLEGALRPLRDEIRATAP